MKYVRRKLMRQYRKDGLPFVDAAKMAKFREKSATAMEIREKYKVEVITKCECCGPEYLHITLSDGSVHEFHMYSLKHMGKVG